MPTRGKGRAQALPRLSFDSVTIIAMGATSVCYIPFMKRGLIPHADERNPVWVINFGAKVWNHTWAWNTHDLNKLAEAEPQMDFINFYKQHDKPLVTLRPVEGLDTLIYPIKEIIEHWQDDYFFGAVPYMLAYAGWCGAKLIRVFGADFDYDDRTDYEAGKGCAEYWMGRLRGTGTQFMIPDETTLLDQHWSKRQGRNGYGRPYGYFDKEPKVFNKAGKLRVKDVSYP
jgi:hypothetical protein